MPNINIEISDELLKALRIRCAEENVMQKDWVPRVLAEALGVSDDSEAGAARGGDAVAGRVPSIASRE